MQCIRAENVSFAFDDTQPILQDCNFSLGVGWTGLVGGNGAGKTTMLRLITQELEPSSGRLIIQASSAPVLCPQIVDTPPSNDSDELKIKLKRRLGTGWLSQAIDRSRWETLSPGERKRLQIVAALAKDPDVLLLDEPTNHLDSGARDLLIEVLASFHGIGIVVSHDRVLLDALTSQTLRIDGGSVRLLPLPYGEAREVWQSEQRSALANEKKAKKQQKGLQRKLQQARRLQNAASRSRSPRRRMKGKHDSDARSMATKARTQAAEKSLGGAVRAIRSRLEHAIESAPHVKHQKKLGGSIFVGYARAPKDILFSVDRADLDHLPVRLDTTNLKIGRHERIWLNGPNGAGKTTLLRALLAGSRIPNSRILSLPQDLGEDDAVTALQEVRTLPKDVQGRTLSILAALGIDPERLLASYQPSPGEARKLLIARGLGQHAWALILDEPTNFLDLPSIERLETAISVFPGAVLAVSHDEQFAVGSRLTTSWQIKDATLVVSSCS